MIGSFSTKAEDNLIYIGCFSTFLIFDWLFFHLSCFWLVAFPLLVFDWLIESSWSYLSICFVCERLNLNFPPVGLCHSTYSFLKKYCFCFYCYVLIFPTCLCWCHFAMFWEFSTESSWDFSKTGFSLPYLNWQNSSE